METTARTIEQILALRLRAAQLRVLERTTALIKEQEAFRQAWGPQKDAALAEHDKLVDARRLADEDVQQSQCEIEAQQAGTEPTHYDPASHFALRRYAAILMQDNAELDAETALKQARADEHVRYVDNMIRTYGPDWDKEPTEA